MNQQQNRSKISFTYSERIYSVNKRINDILNNYSNNSNWFFILLLVLIPIFLFPDITFQNLNFVVNGDNHSFLFSFFFEFIDSIKTYGELNPWNDYIWGGMPAIGNPNIPMNPILYTLLHLDKSNFIVAMNWHHIVELWLALIGMFFLLRCLKFTKLFSLLGALLYLFSWTTEPAMNAIATYFHFVMIPWTLYVIFTLSQRSNLLSITILTALFYYQITYGIIQFSLYSFQIIGIMVFWVFKEKAPFKKSFPIIFISGICAVLFSLHHILPIYEYINEFKSGSRQLLDLDHHIRIAKAPIHHTINLFFPYFQKYFHYGYQGDGWSAWESYKAYIGIMPFSFTIFGFRHIFRITRINLHNIFSFRLAVLILIIIFFASTTIGGKIFLYLNFGKAISFARINNFLIYPLLFLSLYEIKNVFEDKILFKKYTIFCLCFISFIISLHSFGLMEIILNSLYTQGVKLFPGATTSTVSDILIKNGNIAKNKLIIQILLLTAGLILISLKFTFFTRLKNNVIIFLLFSIIILDVAFLSRYERKVGSGSYPYKSTYEYNNIFLTTLYSQNDLNYFNLYSLLGKLERKTGLSSNINSITKIPTTNGVTSFTPVKSDFVNTTQRAEYGQVPYSLTILKLFSIKYLLFDSNFISLNELKKLYGNNFELLSEESNLVLLKYKKAISKYYFPKNINVISNTINLKNKINSNDFNPPNISYIQEGVNYNAPRGCSCFKKD